MIKLIDAIGKACPHPVIMTKKEIDHGEESLIIKVDNRIAVENLKKLAASTGFLVDVKENEDIYIVSFYKNSTKGSEVIEQIQEIEKTTSSDYVVFIGKDYIGEGNKELGSNLMRMFLYTLSESTDVPSHLLFMNGGVKLPTIDDQAVDSLKKLKDRGVEILVCGACLNFYELSEKLKVGEVSNMYVITEKMQQAGKVISF